MEIIFQIGMVLLLVLLNGFFVASEFSLVAVRKTRVEELAKKGNKTARILQVALKDLDEYISATQLGITLASLALGWIGEPVIAHFLEPFFAFLPSNLAFVTAHGLAFGVAFAIITFLHIVLGELAPKSLALARTESTALIVVAPLIIFAKVFKPFIWLLNESGQLVLRLFGIMPVNESQGFHSEEELKMLLRQSSQGGLIELDEAEMALNAFRLDDIAVKDVMVPKLNVIAFNVNATLQGVTDTIEKQLHSRYPVYKNSLNNVIGLVHVKDVLKASLDHEETVRLLKLDIIRKISYFPENKKIDEVFQALRKRQQHMGVVQNSFGKTIGIVYLEDIIESIVGKIEDEFDKPAK